MPYKLIITKTSKMKKSYKQLQKEILVFKGVEYPNLKALSEFTELGEERIRQIAGGKHNRKDIQYKFPELRNIKY